MAFTEAVEPRFAIVYVSNAAGRRVTAGFPARSPTNPDTLATPLRPIGEGWYLVYWRVISADGHPVRGAFTFAVGPNPGPAPQFPIPSLSETAATTQLLIARWVVFLSTLSATGLFVLLALAAVLCVWIDRPERPQRSVAELFATTGALLAAGAYLLVPGAAGHAAQTAPRGLSLAFDWFHLAAGSIWIGGLVGLLVLWWST